MKFKTILATILLAFSTSALCAQTAIKDQQSFSPNLFTNPGFENGNYGWTVSGGATKTANATAKGTGSYGFDWDSNSAAQTMTQSVVVPAAYYGQNGLAYCRIKTPSGSPTHTISVTDGSTTTYGGPTTIGSSTSFVPSSINFVFPSSGSVSFIITSVASNEPEVYIDDCYIGLATNTSNTQQLTAWQSFTPVWTSSGTAPAIGNGTVLGKYRRVGDSAEIQMVITSGTSTTYGSSNAFRFSLPSGLGITVDSTKIPTADQTVGYARADLSTPTFYQGNLVLNSFANAEVIVRAIGATTVWNSTSPATPIAAAAGQVYTLFYTVPIVGWASDIAFRPDMPGVQWTSYTPVLTGNISGTFTNTTTTGFYRCDGDTLEMSAESVFSGAPGTAIGYFQWSLPSGFTADTAKILTTSVGQQVIGFAQGLDNGTSWYRGIVQYQDTTHVTAIMSDTGNQAAPATPFTWGTADLITLYARVPVTAGSPCSRIRAPVLVGSVTSNSIGAERIERANITCSSSSAVNSQSGAWLTSVGNVSSGKCTVTLALSFSSTAYDCHFTRNGTAVASISSVSINNKANGSFDMYMANVSSGSSTIAAGTSESFDLVCMGPR